VKGHGFPAVPQIRDNDVRRGWKPRPFKASTADPALLLDKTFAMAAWGRDPAQCPWLGQIGSGSHQMPGFAKRFEAVGAVAAGRV